MDYTIILQFIIQWEANIEDVLRNIKLIQNKPSIQKNLNDRG